MWLPRLTKENPSTMLPFANNFRRMQTSHSTAVKARETFRAIDDHVIVKCLNHVLISRTQLKLSSNFKSTESKFMTHDISL